MVQLSDEAISLFNLLPQWRDQVIIGLYNPATAPADQMAMGTVEGRGIDHPAFPKVGLAHQPQFYQQIERAIDGSDVEGIGTGPNTLEDLLSGDMTPGAGYRLHDHLPLRGEAIPLFTQFLDQCMAMGHSINFIAIICRCKYYTYEAESVKGTRGQGDETRAIRGDGQAKGSGRFHHLYLPHPHTIRHFLRVHRDW